VKKRLCELWSALPGCSNELINTKEPVYAAISGGADSTSLLLLLHKNINNLRAIHVNHNLRGEESDRDESFCRELCKSLNVPLDVVSVDVRGYAEKTGKSTEEAARDLRYKAFDDITNGKGLVAVAHNADDNAETMIFNLIRGTGLAGLCGIPSKRGNIIRPLLHTTRAEILQFLADEKQDYITDSSNLSDDYSRNYIRHYIMPAIKKLNPSFTDSAERTMQILSEAHSLLERNADIQSSEPILRQQAILSFFRNNNIEPNYRKISIINESIEKTGKAKVEIGKNTYICYDGESLSLQKKGSPDTVFAKTVIKYGETKTFGDKQITLLRQNEKSLGQTTKFHNLLTNNVFDCAKIEGDIILRSRENGDKYVKAGNIHHSKLKTLYNAHLEPAERVRNSVLADDLGIIWVEHFGCAERVSPDNATENTVIIEVK
jgi:tRNA(Ile)-lysidine synthase